MDNAFIILSFGLLGLTGGNLTTRLAHQVPAILFTRWQQQYCQIINITPPLPTGPVKFSSSLFLHPLYLHCTHPHSKRWLFSIILWLWISGRCSSCHKAISFHYSLTELVCGLMFMVIAASDPDPVRVTILLSVTLWLVTVSLVDISHQLLPDIFTLPLIWSGLIFALIGLSPLSLSESLSGTLIGYTLLWIPAMLFRLVKGQHGLGGGDIKLMAGLGAWVGVETLPVIMVTASLSGLIYFLLTRRNRETKNNTIAFGPFLAVAGWLALL
ncbi:prepilin peptidase [Budviciaceae bacterium BWR-B9]|uniref:Prepilin peptidase n=1 Tax=Limnobaculum allomyrinae TaxID=2791986 RepID=A0ABS1INI4_9GAMM|nr:MULTISPECIES: A24 family peptidase [Limnobaculum]MBK5143317.1 prepilin peptidase [Limnobaculum allomyrinae]MBV7691205.1 A24 family peptidase [Limnobaculum sp. M2-1]